MLLIFKKHIGWLTVLALALLPIVRWFFIAPLDARFFDINAVMTSLGQVSGLLGMALFSLNLFLASRLKFLDKYFYGLSRVYNYHRAIGALALSFLLFHPLFLAFKYLRFSLRAAALFLLPFTGDPALTYGIIALVLMIILLSITFYAKIKYHLWKMSHKFMTLVFILALLHVIFISSDISRDYILRYYILALAAIGLTAGFYRAFLAGFFNKDFNYKIINIRRLNPATVELNLEPAGKIMKFQAGQFAFLSLKSPGLNPESHPFSMASAPKEENLRFVIKALGDYTGRLENLRAGDLIALAGPFGKFSYKNVVNKNQIWIAGGVGITPFLSMAKDLTGGDYKVDLYYCAKDKTEAVLIEDLKKIAAIYSNLRIMPWFSDNSGRISAEKIAELSRGANDKDILICGPALFMQSLEEQFLRMEVPAARIHWENFNLI
ncbi:ferric reductase-like transmembrane domain-containing protein [Candidatus Falkowbacteria bacterium]|nr:ferric reductase-like transmembrane domain-containing protein [Candidatus Falkowbacteria bacterium]